MTNLASTIARDAGSSLRPITFETGTPLPFGVRDCCDGFNFFVFSRHAEAVELLLFDTPAATEPALVFPLDPEVHRTGDVWHVLVTGIGWGQTYAWRVRGPWAPQDGHRFDGNALLVEAWDAGGAFRTSPRIELIRVGDGLSEINAVKERMVDLGRPYANLYDVARWSDMLKVKGDELFYAYMVDNQAIVIPETVDAIRALPGRELRPETSINKSNAALGIGTT